MAKGSRGGRRGGGSGVNPGDIVSTRDLMSERGGHQAEVDETMEAFKNVNADYGLVVEEIQIAELKGRSQNVMAYYDGSNVAINQTYFNSAKMTSAYDSCVKSGFHPGRGKKTALEAVAAHELGHALTDKAAAKMGITGIGKLDAAATKIVNQARKQTKHRGVVQMASKISGYAKQSNAEAIAEAFADVYCNGKGARAESRAIVNVMNSYVK